MTESAAPPGLRDWPAFQLYKFGWWFEQRVEDALAQLGLRGRHFMVLTMLEASEDLSQQQMARYMSLDPTLMVALIDELEELGLCERTRHPRDRRRHVLKVTAKGRRIHSRAHAIVDAIQDELLAPLSAAERQRLSEAIERVMEPYWASKVAMRGRPAPKALR